MMVIFTGKIEYKYVIPPIILFVNRTVYKGLHIGNFNYVNVRKIKPNIYHQLDNVQIHCQILLTSPL